MVGGFFPSHIGIASMQLAQVLIAASDTNCWKYRYETIPLVDN